MFKSQTLQTRLIHHWGRAIGFALLLNLALFGLMPLLIDTVPEKRGDEPALNAVDVFRVKRIETPVRKKTPLKPPEPEKQVIKKDPVYVSPTAPKKLRLPFKLNTRLPAGPQTLAMPSLDMIDLNAPDMGDAYDSSDIDAPLTPVSKVPPMYPMRAKRMGIEGWVSVRFLVNSTGGVERIEITAAQPDGVFEESVMRFVSRWRFQPGTIEGVPVNTWAETTIYFKLEDGS